MEKTLILIPSRLSASRLPGKPLLKILGKSIISHVVKKAEESNLGDVYVAAEDQEIVDDVINNGGNALLTSNNFKTGSDRIYSLYKKLNLKNVDYIINLQGDEPNIDVNDLKKLNQLVKKNKNDVGTLAAKINDISIFKNENVVKVETEIELNNNNFPFAKNFKRFFKSDELNIFHHICIYMYKTEVLEKIVKLKRSENEIKNRLEQLRALDNGIKINVALAKFAPIGVDTMEDYLALKNIMEYKSSL